MITPDADLSASSRTRLSEDWSLRLPGLCRDPTPIFAYDRHPDSRFHVVENFGQEAPLYFRCVCVCVRARDC